MFWRRRKPDWFIDPSKVAFGRHEDIRGGRSLDIEHLLVAPILKRRFSPNHGN